MSNFDVKELKVIREGLECVALTSDREAVVSVKKKVDAMLEKEGYRFVRRAFENEWKNLNDKKK
jgi:hypothetical protein